MQNRHVAIIESIFGTPGGDFAPIDGAAYMQHLTDDVRYTVIGSTRFSGTAVGAEGIMAEILMPLVESLDGGIRMRVDTCFGDGERVAMQAHGQAVSKSGARYDNTYCFVFRFRGDQVCEITEYLDTELVRSALG
jgi:ketosteroid isomerase-like protein